MNKTRRIILIVPALLQMGLFATTLSAQNNEVDFEYDARGRLIQMTNHAGQEALYTLDKAGNRTSMNLVLTAPQGAQRYPANQPTALQLTQDTTAQPNGDLEDVEGLEDLEDMEATTTTVSPMPASSTFPQK